jgi:hypothetical protein
MARQPAHCQQNPQACPGSNLLTLNCNQWSKVTMLMVVLMS